MLLAVLPIAARARRAATKFLTRKDAGGIISPPLVSSAPSMSTMMDGLIARQRPCAAGCMVLAPDFAHQPLRLYRRAAWRYTSRRRRHRFAPSRHAMFIAMRRIT